MGCLTEESTPYIRPAMLDVDYGEPVDANCREVGTSGVFIREWTKVCLLAYYMFKLRESIRLFNQ